MGRVMKMDPKKERPQRKRLRLENYDYSKPGAYFITICTHNRRQILSRTVGADVLDGPQTVSLMPYGKIAEKYICQWNEFSDDTKVELYVIMPNHIHIILVVYCGDNTPMGGGASRTSPPTRQHEVVSQFVSTFKRFCNKEYGENIWQRGFHDHIIRDRRDYEKISQYMQDNPRLWREDCFYAEEQNGNLPQK